MKTTNTAMEVYEETHKHAVGMVDEIKELMFALPAPDEEINWSDVGTLNEVVRRLRTVISFINNEEN